MILGRAHHRTKQIVVLAVGTGLALTQPYRPLVVCGGSMEPAYPNHSVVLTTVRTGPLRPGDVVVVSGPTGPLIKRIAYVEGDEVPEIRVADQWMYAGDFGKTRTGHYWRVQIRHVAVPRGKVYVLGDNSYSSVDSRQLGMFDTSQIGRVVLFSRPRARTHWERLFAGSVHNTTW